MLYESSQLPELFYLKHRHDTLPEDDVYYDYENNLLDKSLSPYMYGNDTMSGYLKRLQVGVALLFDHMNVVKNMKNYIVHKYYYKHRG